MGRYVKAKRVAVAGVKRGGWIRCQAAPLATAVPARCASEACTGGLQALARGEAEPRALIEKTRNVKQAKGVMAVAQTTSAQRNSSEKAARRP
jgi:hypothetical protein